MTRSRLAVLVALAMAAFAGNSLLCRAALGAGGMDAASFTTIRLASGAAVLWLLARAGRAGHGLEGDWRSALALFGYAAGFSFAYLSLPAATGALLLFGAVQATMIGVGLARGERLRPWQVLGLLLAGAGLVGLLSPGVSAPSPGGAALMLAAGVAWGIYSLRGQGAGNPLRATAGNFLRAVPFALAISLWLVAEARADHVGIACALASGALASGVGYALWYTALPAMKATSAAAVQLSVPVLAALGGVGLLGEPATLRLALASAAVLGGIALTVFGKHRGSALPAPRG